MTNKAIVFLALSKGKKPTSTKEISKATGYVKQSASIRRAATILKLEVIKTIPDHCTNPKVNWFSRRALRSAIGQATQNKCTLIIYDLIKLLSNCSQEESIIRCRYLKELPITIIDAVTTRSLSGFSERDIKSLTVYKTEESRMTGRAIEAGLKLSDHISTPPSPKVLKVAQRAKAAQAVAFAKSLEATMDRLTTDLTKLNIKPTLQRIANELNIKSITTRRGGQWTATSVKRVKDRLKAINK